MRLLQRLALVVLSGAASVWTGATATAQQPELIVRTSRLYPGQTSFLYVPSTYDGSRPYRLLVSVHGSNRTAAAYARRFAAFGEANDTIVLAPLFPDGTDYQRLGLQNGERVDLRLLDLIDEVAADYRVEREQFDLFGFSGGGQFAHRFLYLHPERLRSVVVAAPGTVTIPSETTRWPAGFGDVPRLATFDPAALSGTRVMLLVGADDVDLTGLNQRPIANLAGGTRLDRVRTLHEAWQTAGIVHTYFEVPGLGHTLDDRVLAPARSFFAASR